MPATPKVAAIKQFSVEWWPTDRPVDYPLNARKWKPAAVAKVAASIKAYGWQQPIVVDSAGVIVIGHLRRAAARLACLLDVPVHVAADLSAEAIRGLRLADNRTHDEAEWDLELLSQEFGELKALEFNLAETAFSLREIEALTLKPNSAEDEIQPIPDVPITKPGDLWTMGGHRVLCGDSTDAMSVARLLGDARPALMVTDPPYGVEYDPTWRDGKGGFSTAPVLQRGKTTNDDRADWQASYELFPGDVAYVWHASLHTGEVMRGLVGAGFEHRAQIIWRKQQALFSRGAYHWQHEPCWYAVRKGKGARWVGDRKQSTVWDIQNLNPTGNREEERVGHGAQKPVECMRRPMLNHDATEVYDPFLGSGTTIIAAESVGRKCFGLELERKYVDVIVTRWEKLTGKKAELCRT